MDLTDVRWRKASLSGNNGGNCVEVATSLPGVVAIRDSKDQQGPLLIFTSDEWEAFCNGVKRGEFRLS
jgi:Domain of unknown function (DUF397)